MHSIFIVCGFYKPKRPKCLLLIKNPNHREEAATKPCFFLTRLPHRWLRGNADGTLNAELLPTMMEFLKASLGKSTHCLWANYASP